MRVSEKQNVCLIAAHAQTVFSVVIDVFTENDALKQRQLNSRSWDVCVKDSVNRLWSIALFTSHAADTTWRFRLIRRQVQSAYKHLGAYIRRFTEHRWSYWMKRVLKVPRWISTSAASWSRCSICVRLNMTFTPGLTADSFGAILRLEKLTKNST